MKKRYVLRKEIKEELQDMVIDFFGVVAIVGISWLVLVIGG